MHTSDVARREDLPSKSTQEAVATLMLKPGRGRHVEVGKYRSGIRLPNFDLEVLPEVGEDLKVELQEVKHRDNTRLIYYFLNFSDKTCRIAIWKKDV